MTNSTPESTCPNCKKAVPATVRLCPNCGANIPPLPEVTGASNPAQTPDTPLLTKSRAGDIAVGIILGVVTPPLLCVVLIAAIDAISTSVALSTVILALFVPLVVGVPFGIAYALKRKRHVAGNAMQKTLFGWLILLGLLFLGLLVLCVTGNFTI